MDDRDTEIGFLAELSLRLEGARCFKETVAILLDFNKTLLPQNYQYDFIVENQRGAKFIGIPMFSSKSLLPLVDPGHYLTLNGAKINIVGNNLESYPAPGLHWKWCWPCWYVLMFNDIDDQGWIYARVFFSNSLGTWKGKSYPGNFVRKRIWMRLRKYDPES